MTGRRIEAIGRRGKQLVIDLTGGAFLTVHLKMTGQLFVVPGVARPMTRTSGSRSRSTTDASCGSATSASSGGSGCTAPTTTRSTGSAPSRSTRGSRCASSASASAGVARGSSRCSWTRRSSPGSATSTPTRRCGGRGSTRCAPRAPLRPADERPCTATSSTSSPRPSSAAARSIDDYTAPDGDGAMQEHLDVYQRTGQPCRRCGRPIRRIVIGIRATHFCSWCQRLPASDRAGGDQAPARDDAPPGPTRPAPAPAGAGSTWTGTGRSGRTDGEADRGEARDPPERRPPPPRVARRRGAAPGAGR